MTEEKGLLNSEPWYKKASFPLLPILKIKEGNEYNTPGFTFTWMGLQLWSLDSVEFELSIVISEHWGAGFVGILPYLRWALTIPMPNKISRWVRAHLYRKINNKN